MKIRMLGLRLGRGDGGGFLRYGGDWDIIIGMY